MNINKLVTNLENTILGKQELLNSLECSHPLIKEILKTNIDELQRILNDVKIVKKQVDQMEADLDGFVHITIKKS